MTNTESTIHNFLVKPLLCLVIISGCYSQNAYPNGWEHTSIDFNVLVLALDDPNPNIRRRAAESLGFRQQTGTTDALLTRLKKNEADGRVRQEIYSALGKIGEKEALSAIQDCLGKERDIAARAQCAGALGNIHSELAEQLALKGIHDENNLVRVQAVASLGSFGSEAAVQALKVLVKDKNTSIKNTALLSLGRTGSMEATKVLIESLGQSSNREQTLFSLQALTFLASPGTAEAIREIYAQSSDEEIKRYALVAMANTRAQGSESLFLDALSSEDSETRVLGLVVLRNFGGPGEVPAIIERALNESSDLLLEDSDQLFLNPTRTIVKLQLLNEYLKTIIRLDPESGEQLYAQSVMPKLIPRSSSAHLKIAQGFYEARWQSLYGLGYTGTDKAGEIIKAALTDPDARIRAVATRSLGVLENSKFVDSIQTMLFDEAAEVRWLAARVLGRLDAAGSIDALIEMLNDTSAQVRLESVLSLGYLNAQAAKQKLSELAEDDPDLRVTEAAIYAASLIE
jgi:HEAT repeat protein